MSALSNKGTYERGVEDFVQDRCENCPFASIGGLSARQSPMAPSWILPDDVSEYVRGYTDAARHAYGPSWATDGFGWVPAITITAKPMTPTEWIAARRAMLAEATPRPWWSSGPHVMADNDNADVAQCESGWDAAVIVAAVNEQKAVLRLVEAAIRLRKETAPYVPVLVSPLPAETARRDFDAAIAALVGEEGRK